MKTNANRTIKVPSFKVWKNLEPGPGRKPTLHITGIVFATLCQTPYLKPLKGPMGLMFEVAYRWKKAKFCPEVEIPREIEPYNQIVTGKETEVLIRVGKTDLHVKIQTVS